jgi:hypothetical protein
MSTITEEPIAEIKQEEKVAPSPSSSPDLLVENVPLAKENEEVSNKRVKVDEEEAVPEFAKILTTGTTVEGTPVEDIKTVLTKGILVAGDGTGIEAESTPAEDIKTALTTGTLVTEMAGKKEDEEKMVKDGIVSNEFIKEETLKLVGKEPVGEIVHQDEGIILTKVDTLPVVVPEKKKEEEEELA